jgi:hypothetical protein
MTFKTTTTSRPVHCWNSTALSNRVLYYQEVYHYIRWFATYYPTIDRRLQTISSPRTGQGGACIHQHSSRTLQPVAWSSSISLCVRVRCTALHDSFPAAYGDLNPGKFTLVRSLQQFTSYSECCRSY